MNKKKLKVWATIAIRHNQEAQNEKSQNKELTI
jgi:hypothetical protein